MELEVIFACVGALVVLSLAVGAAAFMISYAHQMWSRFSARKWYWKGREDEANGIRDFFENQPKPSWRL